VLATIGVLRIGEARAAKRLMFAIKASLTGQIVYSKDAHDPRRA